MKIECYVDPNGNYQGPYKRWYRNNQIQLIGHVINSKYIGELIAFNIDGSVCAHVYWDKEDRDNGPVHDFLKHPLADEEKMLLVLKHGAPLLPRGEIC